MGNEKLTYPKFNYDEHARTCAENDYLGQICRTVKGVPIPNEQIMMIVEAIHFALKPRPDDVVLELACGNGSISQYLFDSCKEYLGVDVSEYLISVAKNNFEKMPHYQFLMQNCSEYVKQERRPERFTKALCYAGLQYLSDACVIEVLKTLFDKYVNVNRLFIGNLPDKERVRTFYTSRQPSMAELLDRHTAIGIWRTKDEFSELVNKAGWKVTFSTMPEDFYASYYRYDALLVR